ncbi:ribonuclease H-like domain-containing protein [Tanacetum coccineum]
MFHYFRRRRSNRNRGSLVSYTTSSGNTFCWENQVNRSKYSLPSDGHVVLPDSGQPGLDELDFDDLYNNLKVYEHELKGVSNSNSQNIAFLSTEVKGSTLKQSTAEPTNIPKGYTQAASSKVLTAPNYASHSEQKRRRKRNKKKVSSVKLGRNKNEGTLSEEQNVQEEDTTHHFFDDTADQDAAVTPDLERKSDGTEEVNMWQVAMITARIRKFMRKTGRPIDLKPKNGITFDKSKIECFNCQKLGHFARECRFAKYQENRANGRKEKKIVAIEDSNSKALVAKDNNEEIDWTKECDAEPVTFAMMALTELEEDDWSMEIDAEPVHFGKDRLGDFDWSNKADDTLVSLALMATNSEVPYSQPEIDRNKVIIEDWVDSDDEETALNFLEIQKKTVLNSKNSETSFENKSPSSQNSVGQGSRKTGVGHKGVYLPRHSSLIIYVWHVERENSTGLLARRLKKEQSENL